MTPRVLLISPVFPPARGGIETLACELATGLPDADVRVLTAEQEGWQAWDQSHPVDVVRVRNKPRGGRKTQARLTTRAVVEAVRFRPDVVLSMEVRSGPAAQLVRTLCHARWVQYWHAKEIATWPRQAHFAASRSDINICVSHYTRQLLQPFGAEDARTAVISNGIDSARHRQQPGTNRAPRLLTVARMEDCYKGHDVIIQALPTILRSRPDAEWVIAGDGRRRSTLEREVNRRGLQNNVRFLGWVSEDEKQHLLDTSRAFVMPSRVPRDEPGGEGFGIVYLEAAAHGLPSVAADEGGARDAVLDGHSGHLVDPRDPDAVAGAVVALLTDDDEFERMSTAARAWAVEHDWASLMPRIRELL